jgi:hypothetical protein
MPYLQFLFCERCGPPSNLDIDSGATISEYIKEGRSSSFINPATVVWDYLIYSCSICRASYKYTYPDVERRTREYFSSLSKEYKDYFDALAEAGTETANQKFIKTKPGSETRVRERYTNKT